MTESDFRVRVVSQGWLDGAAEVGLGTHGQIHLAMGGATILWHEPVPEQPLPFTDDRWEWGVGASALALLQTLFQDHAMRRSAKTLIVDGCDQVDYLMTCNAGVDWSVRHEAGLVTLADVRVFGLDDMPPPLGRRELLAQRWLPWRRRAAIRRLQKEMEEPARPTHPHLRVTLPWRDYATEILAFAEVARRPYLETEKRFDDDFYRETYEGFRTRYDALLERARSRLRDA